MLKHYHKLIRSILRKRMSATKRFKTYQIKGREKVAWDMFMCKCDKIALPIIKEILLEE